VKIRWKYSKWEKIKEMKNDEKKNEEKYEKKMSWQWDGRENECVY